MKLNAKELPVIISPDGSVEKRDVRKDFGNFLWNYSHDVALSDIGRDIYNSEGEIEIPDTYKEEITDMINQSTYYAPVKKALLQQINHNN